MIDWTSTEDDIPTINERVAVYVDGGDCITAQLMRDGDTLYWWNCVLGERQPFDEFEYWSEINQPSDKRLTNLIEQFKKNNRVQLERELLNVTDRPFKFKERSPEFNTFAT